VKTGGRASGQGARVKESDWRLRSAESGVRMRNRLSHRSQKGKIDLRRRLSMVLLMLGDFAFAFEGE
jgi:hypothetical protein